MDGRQLGTSWRVPLRRIRFLRDCPAGRNWCPSSDQDPSFATRTMELCGRACYKQREYRAALALDTIGDRQIARPLVVLLETDPVPLPASTVIDQLIHSADPWLRILAVRSLPELRLREFVPSLHQLKSDPDPLLRQAKWKLLQE
jgi:hypothetical protein